ncbi:serine/threonine protein kinase [Mucilaginibacter sp. OK098]|uniref:serine/threonine protein kinase n=1 Tax=Mucilaginibacter sp. OK098 TaxID=1855297 RepID=UPI00091A55D7|nr:serine/threonine-protein kinase [Mucilaginibacter sp. OK098]SHM20830.1 serine/threonine protein kinase [Mucilaginibacter sp. OK098]
MSKVFTITEGLENMGALRTGGQGSVYKGKRIGPIISAVKLLPTPIHSESKDDHNYRNFLNEVEKLRKVNEIPNPNVVKILNSGITESGSLPFIEMEFIEGPDLGELLKPPHEAIFTIKEVIKLADQLACALSHCHKVGVKHGDIKSNNIKFNIHSGNYVLLDFGLSVMSDEQRRSSMRHAGAIEFMAPEQSDGEILFQTDIYSYGVILFELLAGQVPFPLKDNGETARNTVMLSHLEKPVPDVLELRRENLPKSWSALQQEKEMQVPAWLLQIITKCLEKSPDNRYANGTELNEAIIENTISESNDGAANTIIALRLENEKLQQQLLTYQQADAVKKNRVHVSKPLFAGLVLLIIASITYGLFKTSPVKSNLSLPSKDTSALSQKKVSPDTIANKTKHAAAIDTAKKDTSKSAVTKPLSHKKKPLHKKKKFLGIFPI